jgi:nicotinamide mononucleotide transporter
MTQFGALELSAVVFNVVYVILAAKKNLWCWPAGILGSGLSIVLFIQSKLYAEAVLFAYYVIMGFYGLYNWRANETETHEIKIDTWNLKSHFKTLVTGYLLTLGLFYFLSEFTDAEMPLLDSFTTIFSFIATWMVAKRLLENWIYWIGINALSVYLYFSRELYLYSILVAFFVFMSIYGYNKWRLSSKYVEHGKEA